MDLGEMQVKLRNLRLELCIFLDGTVYKWFFLLQPLTSVPFRPLNFALNYVETSKLWKFQTKSGTL